MEGSLLQPMLCCLCSCLMFWFSFLHCFPKLYMRSILQAFRKRCKAWNSVEHMSKRTHEHRSVVLPCPDFLYSTVTCDFASDPATVLLFKAPANVYASLGLYDDTAGCVDIVSHPGQELHVAIVGPDVVGSDAEVLRALHLILPTTDGDGADVSLAGECAYVVRRLPTFTGLLLHRMLIPDPAECDEVAALQVAQVTCQATRLPHVSRSHLLKPPGGLLRRLGNYTSAYIHISTAIPCLIALLSVLVKDVVSSEAAQLHPLLSLTVGRSVAPVWAGILGLGLVVGAVLALVTLKQLKKPRNANSFLRLVRRGLWNFNALDTSDPSGGLGELGRPFTQVIFFLHGALGLLPSEVYYAVTSHALESLPNEAAAGEAEGLEDCSSSSRVALRPGESYNIDISTLNLRCAWWSISVYGSDLFLVPNDAGVYSVNSFQLQKILEEQKQHSPDSLRVVCSPTRPEQLRANEVFWLPMPASPERGDEGKSPRLVLRAYLPQSHESWLSDLETKKVQMPSVQRRSSEQ